MQLRIKSYHAGCHVVQRRYLGFLWIDMDSWGLYETYSGARDALKHHAHRMLHYPMYSKVYKVD